MIEFRNVHKSFGPQKVLDDVTLEIPQGQTTVIIGPSGTGKSVFIKLLVGLLKPEQGEIFVAGQEITRLKDRELFEVRDHLGLRERRVERELAAKANTLGDVTEELVD